MTPLPWMPTYVQNWLTSEKVSAMTIAQEGAYNRLLLLAWDNKDCTITAEVFALKRLAKWNGHPDEDFQAVLDCFVPHPKLPGRLYNEVQMKKWVNAQRIQKHNSKVRRAAALVRWQFKGNAKALQPDAQNNDKNRDTNKKKEKKTATRRGVDDQVWMDGLKADKAYQGLDVDVELAKAQRWCAERGRTCSRRFFVNWLNRAEKPMRPGPGGSGPARSITDLAQLKKP